MSITKAKKVKIKRKSSQTLTSSSLHYCTNIIIAQTSNLSRFSRRLWWERGEISLSWLTLTFLRKEESSSYPVALLPPKMAIILSPISTHCTMLWFSSSNSLWSRPVVSERKLKRPVQNYIYIKVQVLMTRISSSFQLNGQDLEGKGMIGKGLRRGRRRSDLATFFAKWSAANTSGWKWTRWWRCVHL